MTTAALKLFQRLREIEKIELRAANHGQLEHLAHHEHQSDLIFVPESERVSTLAAVQDLCNQEFSRVAAHPTFGQTWLF